MFFIFTLFYLLRVCYGFDPSSKYSKSFLIYKFYVNLFIIFYLISFTYYFFFLDEPQQILIDFLNKYNYSSDTKQNQ